MAEENQVTTKAGIKENQVTTKNPKKVEVGRRLPEYNHKKREELKVQKSEELKSEVSQYFSIGTILAVGVIGGLGYYLYQAKKGKVTVVPNNPSQRRPQVNKFEKE